MFPVSEREKIPDVKTWLESMRKDNPPLRRLDPREGQSKQTWKATPSVAKEFLLFVPPGPFREHEHFQQVARLAKVKPRRPDDPMTKDLHADIFWSPMLDMHIAVWESVHGRHWSKWDNEVGLVEPSSHPRDWRSLTDIFAVGQGEIEVPIDSEAEVEAERFRRDFPHLIASLNLPARPTRIFQPGAIVRPRKHGLDWRREFLRTSRATSAPAVDMPTSTSRKRSSSRSACNRSLSATVFRFRAKPAKCGRNIR